MNKRGLSPIIATILLIAFAVAIGVMIMSWTTGTVKESTHCDDISDEIINVNAFCKLTDKIIPRVQTEDNKYTVCEEKAMLLSQMKSC